MLAFLHQMLCLMISEKNSPRESVENPAGWCCLEEAHGRTEDGECHAFMKFAGGLAYGKAINWGGLTGHGESSIPR